MRILLFFLSITCAAQPPVFHDRAEGAARIRKISPTTIDLDIDADRLRAPSALPFHIITFDLRDHRGGQGDVAAAYLMALDLIQRFQFAGEIQFILHKNSLRILTGLIGDSTVLQKQIRLIEYQDIPADLEPTDFLIKLASAKGKNFSDESLQNTDIEGYARSKNKFPVHSRTLMMVAPVFAASEVARHRYWDSFTSFIYRGVEFQAPPPGADRTESGIYSDPVAFEFKSLDRDKLRQVILAEIAKIKKGSLRQQIEKIIFASGRVFGFAYGISHAQTKSQFSSYLRGILRDSQQPSLILTPSQIESSEVDPDLAQAVKVSPLRSVSQDSDSKILVVTTPNLSHRLFTALLAYSELPPIVAGDNAYSAVQILGRPFVMTQVPWNKQVVKDVFLDLASEASSRSVTTALNRIAAGDLSDSLKLVNQKSLFRQRADVNHSFFDVVLAAASRIRSFVDKEAKKLSRLELLQFDNRALNVEIAFEQLQSKSASPFSEADIKQVFELGLYGRNRSHGIDSRMLKNAGLRESVYQFFRSRRPYGGIGHYYRLRVIESGNDAMEELRANLVQAADTCRNLTDPLSTEEGYSAVRDAAQIVEVLDLIGTADAERVLSEVGLQFPVKSISLKSRDLLLNRWSREGESEKVEQYLRSLSRNELSWMAQSLAFHGQDVLPHFIWLTALLRLLPPDHYSRNGLRARLRIWGVNCSEELAPEREMPEKNQVR